MNCLQRNRSNLTGSRRQGGFTLIELIVALALFALLVSICYTALGPASEGFRDLTVKRDELGRLEWVARQLRLDAGYAVASRDVRIRPFVLQTDRRGNTELDSITFTTHELGRPALSQVRYFVDQQSRQLIREAGMPWTRSGEAPVRWAMGNIDSFRVEVMAANGGGWQQVWQGRSMPRAIKVAVRDAEGEREWVFPIDAEDPAIALQSADAASAIQ